MSIKRVAVITARGGSKRIPRKNIKSFLGKPIIAYSIEAALQTGLFDEVMVSTDDEEIASVARSCGAVVPFMRSEETANDFATTAEVILEVIDTYEQAGKHFDYVCCIYPTAPFVTAKALQEAMTLLEEGESDCVIPVVKYSFPPQRCVIVNQNGKLEPKWPECMKMRSQDLEPYYHDCGQFYAMRTDSFRKQKKIWMRSITPFFQEEINVQDIDTEEDWKMAEVKYQMIHGNETERGTL